MRFDADHLALALAAYLSADGPAISRPGEAWEIPAAASPDAVPPSRDAAGRGRLRRVWSTPLDEVPAHWLRQVVECVGEGPAVMAEEGGRSREGDRYAVGISLRGRNGAEAEVEVALDLASGTVAPLAVVSVTDADGSDLAADAAGLRRAFAEGGAVPMPALGVVAGLHGAKEPMPYAMVAGDTVRIRPSAGKGGAPDPASFLGALRLADAHGVTVSVPHGAFPERDLRPYGFVPQGRWLARPARGRPVPATAPDSVPLSRGWAPPASAADTAPARRPYAFADRPAQATAPRRLGLDPAGLWAAEAALATLREVTGGVVPLLDDVLDRALPVFRAGGCHAAGASHLRSLARLQLRKGWDQTVVLPLAMARDNPLQKALLKALPRLGARTPLAERVAAMEAVVTDVPEGTTARAHAEMAMRYAAASAAFEEAVEAVTEDVVPREVDLDWLAGGADGHDPVRDASLARDRIGRHLSSSSTAAGLERLVDAVGTPDGAARAFPGLPAAWGRVAALRGPAIPGREQMVGCLEGLSVAIADATWSLALARPLTWLLASVPGSRVTAVLHSATGDGTGTLHVRVAGGDGFVAWAEAGYDASAAVPARGAAWTGDRVPLAVGDGVRAMAGGGPHRPGDPAHLACAAINASPACPGIVASESGTGRVAAVACPGLPPPGREAWAAVAAEADLRGVAVDAALPAGRGASIALAGLGFVPHPVRGWESPSREARVLAHGAERRRGRLRAHT